MRGGARVIIFSLAMPLFMPHVAQAAEVAARGIGTLSCAQFAQMYRADPKDANVVFGSWGQGFMSGWNAVMIQNHSYRDLGSETVDETSSYIREYCDQHPLGSFVDAVMDTLLKMPLKVSPQPH